MNSILCNMNIVSRFFLWHPSAQNFFDFTGTTFCIIIKASVDFRNDAAVKLFRVVLSYGIL